MNKSFLALAGMLATALTGVAQRASQIQFNLHPDPTMTACITDGSGRQPFASVTVTRGNLLDTMNVSLHNVKPGLAFDVFTVERSKLLSNGQVDPGFSGKFGLAWYQSDLETNGQGGGATQVKSILLDQIFGFDADTSLGPINTFHVGAWFNNPNDAAPCGFDPTKPTPFNGEHNAGPVALISVPNASTNLGPLCTDPNLSTNPVSCNP